jgi:hypothetical protein
MADNLSIAVSVCALIGAVFTASGCAIHYFDKQTGTEHLWGVGHMKMRAAPQAGDAPTITNGAVAFVTGVRTFGLNFGVGEDFGGLGAGWDSRSRVIIKAEDAQFYLLWPSNSIWLPWNLKDVFTLRVGTNFPHFANPEPKESP